MTQVVNAVPTADTTADTAAGGSDETSPEEHPEIDSVLIEEVSIDGLCGVY
jgi:mycofactocin precursor